MFREFFCRIYIHTRDWVDFTDIDTKQAETASSHKAQTLQVQQGGSVLKAF